MNMIACSRVLALIGSTYAHRLWCAWELFTLFAFVGEDQARSRVQLAPLLDDADMSVYAALLSFDVRRAHCYDPNEEWRLRQVIDSIGARQFEASINRLSRACIEDQRP